MTNLTAPKFTSTYFIIASDHAGFEFKNQLIEKLAKKFQFQDLGTHSDQSVDFPDYADLVVKDLSLSKETISDKNIFGILICGSGQGMAMRANKYPHIRAALCWSLESTKLSREHNDANILCLGARLIELDLAVKMVEQFALSTFMGGRHSQRVNKICTPI